MPKAAKNGLDRYDRLILSVLQEDNQISNQALAATIGLSPPACLRRVRRLRESKVIRSDVSIVDPTKVGDRLMMVAMVQVEKDRLDLYDDFKRLMKLQPEVMHCLVVTGLNDFVLLLSLSGIDHYERFDAAFFRANRCVRRVESMVVTAEVKLGLAFPVI